MTLKKQLISLPEVQSMLSSGWVVESVLHYQDFKGVISWVHAKAALTGAARLIKVHFRIDCLQDCTLVR